MSHGNFPRHRLLQHLYLLGVACFLARHSLGADSLSAIHFTAEVPAAPRQMQAYKLAATPAPLEFLNERLRAVKLPAMNLEKRAYLARGATGLNEVDRVRAYADPESGDTHFIPNLAELTRSVRMAKPLALESVQRLARAALTDARFIPKDVTQTRIAEPITVMAGATEHASIQATRVRPQAETQARVMMTIVPAMRYASEYRVYGLGSHALVSVAHDGAIVGALRRWRTASLGERIKSELSAKQVRAEIERQLRPHVGTEGTRATVDKILIAYYDGNAKFLQPVYRFEATIEPADKQVSKIRIAGYVPIGKALEPIPDLAAEPAGPRPESPQRLQQPSLAERLQPIEPLAAAEFARLPAQVTLGEYANQDWPNDSGYVDMAASFLKGLTFGNVFFHASTPRITRTQWYVAYPWEVVGPSSRAFMNAVNVAYTVPHGDWLLNTTKSNNADLWRVTDIGTQGNPGFGAAAGGVLATWVIMSCEVIPSMHDRQVEEGAADNPYAAFDAWWPVFQGLHNAIGFRTVMFYPDDNLQWGFGLDAAMGGDVNAAWFQEVAVQDGNDGTYHDDHLIGHPLVHYDRASSMIDARNLGQSIYSVGAQSASTTLWNFWMND
jgi:Family of unknown function (DUF6345)